MNVSWTHGVFRFSYLIALSTICSSVALGAPAVTSVTGNLSHGQSVTISGSGFGSHANYNNVSGAWKGGSFLNFRFKDFEDGQLNSNGFFPYKAGANWSPASGSLGVLSGGPANSTKYMRRAYVDDELGGLSATMSGAGNQVYTTFKFMLAPNTQSGKFWRIYGDAPQNNVYLSTGCSGVTIRGASECTATSCAAKATQWGSGPALTEGQWHRVELLADASTNTFSAAVDGIAAWTASSWLNTSLQANGHTLDFPNMIDSSSRDPSCPATGSYNYDDIFVDFTRARVELADASSWSAARKKEVQVPVTWTSNSISIRVNAGTFSTGQTAYLYVIDSSGAVNSQGLPVRIGAAGVVQPEPPTDIQAN